MGLVRKIAGPVLRKPAKLALCAAGIAIAVYGGYAFWKNGIGSYLFLFSSFVFFDFERPAFLFLPNISPSWACLCGWAMMQQKGCRR